MKRNDPSDAIAGAFGSLLTLPSAFAELQAEVRRMASAMEAMQRGQPAALVTVEEAARVLGVSVPTVRRRVRAGDIPARRFGRAVRVDLSALRPASDAEVSRLAAAARRAPTGT